MTSPLFVSSNEARQVLGKKVPFARTLTSDNSEVVIDVSKHMQEATKIMISVSGAPVYINFDEDASKVAGSDGTIHSILLNANEIYSESSIFISSKITAINAEENSANLEDMNATVRGIIWGR